LANTYFQFKQFTIHQEHCAMKVCTDACLFGALVYRGPQQGKYRVLDIGAGTGLLSLMFAQKNPNAFIDAVEMDEAAAKQAAENFDASPWRERLKVFRADILEFTHGHNYDLIISNPPFFENDLRPSDAARANAMHESSLSLPQLLRAVRLHLSPDGLFGVLLPAHRVMEFEEHAAERNYHINRKIMVKQSPGHDHFRGILFFSGRKVDPEVTEITIRSKEGVYSDEFIRLLKEYYLNL
jgi:tRNA1Val (adenine37-N6)-methyltransferase